MYYCTKALPKTLPQKPLILFVGGAMDRYYKPLLEGVYLPYFHQYSHRQDVVYAPHHSRKNLLKWMQHWQDHNQVVCLIGHSWGCQSIMDVAYKASLNSQHKIHYLVTLDPVSRKYINRRKLKPNTVDTWINIYIDSQQSRLERSNLIAYFGGRWDHRDNADENIFLQEQFGEEVTHAKARLMFACIKELVAAL